MTDTAARALLERLKTDPAFRERVLAFAEPAERLAALRAEGFDLELGELATRGERLRDAELEACSGGHYPCDDHDPFLPG